MVELNKANQIISLKLMKDINKIFLESLVQIESDT